jgi:hypothetical protein
VHTSSQTIKKQTNMKRIFSLIALTTILFTSCKKDTVETYDTNVKASLSIEFDNIVGSSDLQLNTGNYTNAIGEAYKITTLKYFVSNFTLTKSDGSIYTIPQDSSYFLIDESVASSLKPTLKVPEGEYSSISFIVGVDSLRNTKDISQRTGVLDPTGAASGMYWSWNSGYIFFKLEGTAASSPQTGNVFQYHIGLFGGYTTPTINNLKTVTLNLTARGVPKVKANKATNVHLMADVSKVFTGTSNISFTTTSSVHGATGSAAIANNYAAMFKHDHTEN